MASDQSERAHVLVRVWLPDRPGALGSVASRIGSVRGDIVGIDVLERGDDVAVDEFAVDLESLALVDMLVREIEQVDGVSVEEVRVVGVFPDPRLDALESAALLCEARGLPSLQRTLVAHVRRELLADWVALVRADGETILTDGETPDSRTVSALAIGTSASPAVAEGTSGPEDLAVAPLDGSDALLLVGRDGHPFRRRERAQLVALVRVAARLWTLCE